MSDDTAVIHIDGASRGNPGEAAYAVVINAPGRPPVEEYGTLGKETNNIAENTARLTHPEDTNDAASPPDEESGTLSKETNNVAEYTALIKALEKAKTLGLSRLLINSDSELLVKQVNGEYRVKNDDLKWLSEEAKRLM